MRAMTSAKFRPAARTSTRTWPGPGTGSGRSWTCRTSGPPCLVMTTARMPPTLRHLQVRAGVLDLGLEDARLGKLRAVPEERPVGDPRDDHQHDTEQQHRDPDGDRDLDAPQRRRVG